MICEHITEIIQLINNPIKHSKMNMYNKMSTFFSYKPVSSKDYCVLCGSRYPQDYGFFMTEKVRNCTCIFVSSLPNIVIAAGG